MRNDRWIARSLRRLKSKFLPDWFLQKGAKRMAWLLILACIHWQVTDRLDGQQIYFALIYAKAQIGLFVGLDPEATMVVSFPSREYNVYRYDVANFMQLDVEWDLLTDAVSRGLKLAFLIIFALLVWSFGNVIIEKKNIAKGKRLESKLNAKLH